MISFISASESKEKRVDDTPEGIQARLLTYHGQTDHVINFYRRLGKVRDIDGSQDLDAVYRDTRKALVPNMVFLYGPPVSFINFAAFKLQLRRNPNYVFLDPEAFYENQGLSKAIDEIKIDKFMKFLDTNPNRNFIISNFQNIRQAKIFNDNFGTPKILFYIDCSQDQFEDTLRIYNKADRLAQVQAYDRYVKARKELLPYYKDAPYFKKISWDINQDNMLNQIFNHSSPEILFIPTVDDLDYATLDYLNRLRDERGYIYLDVNKLIKDEISRGTSNGKNLTISADSYTIVNFLRSVIFEDPDKKKFILGGFPQSSNDLTYFEQNICKLPFAILNATQGFPSENAEVLREYHAEGRLIKIDGNYLDQFDEYLQDRCKWGFVLGPIAENNARVVKYLDNKYATKVISWSAIDKEMKARFTDEDGNEPEELTFDQYCIYFKEKLPKLKRSDNILFDGWPTDKEEFILQKFIEKVGAPSYIMYVTITKEVLVKKYKEDNNVGPEDEFPSEADEDINNKLSAATNQIKTFEDLISNGTNINIFQIDGNLSQPELQKNLANIISKRVIVFGSTNENNYSDSFSNSIKGHCAINNITFMHIPEMIAQLLNNHDLYTDPFIAELREQYVNNIFLPETIIKLVKRRLASAPCSK